MTGHVKISGTWKEVNDPKVKVSGTWKPVSDGWVKVGGTWKKWYSRFILAAGITSFLAGTQGTAGFQDGTGTGAKFTTNTPTGSVIGPDGNMYMCDPGNRRVRKITPTGVVTTFVGDGVNAITPGTGTGAQVGNVFAICYNAQQGCFFVVNQGGYMMKVTTAGVMTVVSSALGNTFAITAAPDGNMYFTNVGQYAIKKVTPAGVITTLTGSAASQGYADGDSTTARFRVPRGIVMHSNGYLYVGDEYRIRCVDTSGNVVTICGGTAGVSGNASGTGTTARFRQVQGMVETPENGYLYVTDMSNHNVKRITVSTTVNGGTVAFVAGSTAATPTGGYAEGTGAAAQFNSPDGIAAAVDGTLYVSDRVNCIVRKIV